MDKVNFLIALRIDSFVCFNVKMLIRMKNVIIISLFFLSGCASLKTSLKKSHNCPDFRSERLEFWNGWLDACAPGNYASSTNADWSETTFRTVGVTYEGFKVEDSLDYHAMVALYDSVALAEKYLPSIILSGSDYPDKALIKKGEYLTKLVKIGANISGYSVYYITPQELARLKRTPSRIEQALGLPLTSNAGAYLIYRMYASDDNVVYQSHVAPTIQYNSPREAVYWTSGGATQTLVINHRDTTLWLKDRIPSDTLKVSSLPDINQLQKMEE